MQFVSKKGGTRVMAISDSGMETAGGTLPWATHSSSLAKLINHGRYSNQCKYIVSCGDNAVGSDEDYGGYQGQFSYLYTTNSFHNLNYLSICKCGTYNNGYSPIYIEYSKQNILSLNSVISFLLFL
jgi:hypothetical protein